MSIKRLWISLFLLSVLTWGTLSACEQGAVLPFWLAHQPDADPNPSWIAPSPQPSSVGSTTSTPAAIIPPIQVDQQQLLADVQALGYVRQTERDRAHAREYIRQALIAAGWAPDVHSFPQGVNIVAQRAGTDPEAGTVVLAAHYDTVERSPGADDNATGIATILEAARRLGSIITPRTLRLVLFDQEEAGLLGSQAFVADPTQRASIKAAVVLDMIGYRCRTAGCQQYPAVLPMAPPTDRGTFLAVIGDQGHQPLLNIFQQVHQPSQPQVLTLAVPTLGPLTPDVVRSDHAPFWRNGIGAVLVTDTANFRNPHYHQPSDTVETLDPEFFAGSVQIVLEAIALVLNSQQDLATPPHPAS